MFRFIIGLVFCAFGCHLKDMRGYCEVCNKDCWTPEYRQQVKEAKQQWLAEIRGRL